MKFSETYFLYELFMIWFHQFWSPNPENSFFCWFAQFWNQNKDCVQLFLNISDWSWVSWQFGIWNWWNHVLNFSLSNKSTHDKSFHTPDEYIKVVRIKKKRAWEMSRSGKVSRTFEFLHIFGAAEKI